jgi:ubiquinone/menaquinone biosynthesis C-methylase UbiE
VRNFAKFWDRIAPGYAKRPVADEAAYEHKLEKTREYLTPEMSVLEFGCGTGSTAIRHAPYVKRIRAIDVSTNMIDIARGKAAGKNVDNVAFEVANIDELTLQDGEYDVVMAHSILHLLSDIEPVLAKIHRTLKPGGVFVSSTLCVGDSIVGKIICTAISLVSPTGTGALHQHLFDGTVGGSRRRRRLSRRSPMAPAQEFRVVSGRDALRLRGR